MSLEQNLPHLSSDLILEIISRLPSKSIARFRCLSKLWTSLLNSGSPYFTELFLTHSKTRPRLLFAVHRNDYKWYIYSSPQPQISYKNSKSSSLTVTAEFQMAFPVAWFLQVFSPPVSGFIYYSEVHNSNGIIHPVVCNPSTGQILWLPNLRTSRKSRNRYFGYDPIDKKFSVLSICFPVPFRDELPSSFHILNFKSGELYWRSLICPLQHTPYEVLSTCINGVLYYIASLSFYPRDKLACFDFHSEEFKFIDLLCSYHDPTVLVNFKGKVCGIRMMRWIQFDDSERSNIELRLWILEDFEKQKWSTHSYRLPSRLRNENHSDVSLVGVSVRGDIVLSLLSDNLYYVYFFNPEKNTLQEVEVKGLDEEFKSNKVYGFVDYVEDLRTLFN